MRKLDAESDAIRRAAKLADEGYRVFMQAVRPGRADYELIASETALAEWVAEATRAGVVAFDCETDALDCIKRFDYEDFRDRLS